ncbi:MAG: glycosyl transferase [bacterium]|nr:glycosyl transferase [bacterium]
MKNINYTRNMKIPKIIHYCWFGKGEYPEIVKCCMSSWQKKLFDYQFIKWDEDNFDINSNTYVKEAYQAGKYAFVADYVRLYALYTCGGIYLDTDVEVLKNFDYFLTDTAFLGFEVKGALQTAVIGSTKEHKFIQDLLGVYQNKKFIKNNGEYDLTTNVKIITKLFLSKGLILNGRKQNIGGFILYPQVIFAPNTFSMLYSQYPKAAYVVHHFVGSWLDHKIKRETLFYKLGHYISGVLRNFLGNK